MRNTAVRIGCGGRAPRGRVLGTWRPLVVRSQVRLAVLLVGVMTSGAAQALTITFDETPLAPATFDTLVPGGPFGPELSFGPVNLGGGGIGLAISPGNLAATTLPNFYATTDFAPLADGSLLPGEITATIAGQATSIRLDVGNGNLFPAVFTLTAFNGDNMVASDAVSLAAFASATGFVGELTVAAPAITRFTITSDQPTGFKLFTVDTIEIALVPEPGTLCLILVGGTLLTHRAQRTAYGAMRKARPQSRLELP